MHNTLNGVLNIARNIKPDGKKTVTFTLNLTTWHSVQLVRCLCSMWFAIFVFLTDAQKLFFIRLTRFNFLPFQQSSVSILFHDQSRYHSNRKSQHMSLTSSVKKTTGVQKTVTLQRSVTSPDDASTMDTSFNELNCTSHFVLYNRSSL